MTDWSTPQDLFDILDKEFNFKIDVCASKENAKCKYYITKEEDALHLQWLSTCWMNPPYGPGISTWMAKAYNESRLHSSTVVCLVPATTYSEWWHEYAMKGEIRFIRGKVHFANENGKTGRAPFSSAVVIFRKDNHECQKFGSIDYRRKQVTKGRC